LFVTGKGTVFEGDKAIALSAVKDGTSNTIIVVEVKNSGVNWAQPQDVDFGQPTAFPPGNHPGGNIVAFADGSVRFISQTVPPATIHALATKDGQESVIPP
jgi:prepilin-type processing-associated H-X9-DG protein